MILVGKVTQLYSLSISELSLFPSWWLFSLPWQCEIYLTDWQKSSRLPSGKQTSLVGASGSFPSMVRCKSIPEVAGWVFFFGKKRMNSFFLGRLYLTAKPVCSGEFSHAQLLWWLSIIPMGIPNDVEKAGAAAGAPQWAGAGNSTSSMLFPWKRPPFIRDFPASHVWLPEGIFLFQLNGLLLLSMSCLQHLALNIRSTHRPPSNRSFVDLQQLQVLWLTTRTSNKNKNQKPQPPRINNQPGL